MLVKRIWQLSWKKTYIWLKLQASWFCGANLCRYLSVIISLIWSFGHNTTSLQSHEFFNWTLEAEETLRCLAVIYRLLIFIYLHFVYIFFIKLNYRTKSIFPNFFSFVHITTAALKLLNQYSFVFVNSISLNFLKSAWPLTTWI